LAAHSIQFLLYMAVILHVDITSVQ